MSNRKHCEVKINMSESVKHHKSGTDERIKKSGIGGKKTGYSCENK